MRSDGKGVATPEINADVARILAAAVSHGVRTPLHSLLGFLELLATTELDDETRSIVTEARTGGDELLVASDRLLILLRLLIGDQADPPQSFSPADLLRDVARATGSEDTVRTDVNPYLPAILGGDLEALRQLLVELVGNAVRHGAGRTRVYAERVGDFAKDLVQVQFTVADDGPGLPAEALRRFSAHQQDLGEEPKQVGLFLAGRLARRLATTLTIAQSDDRGTIIKFDVCLHDRLHDTAAGIALRKAAAAASAQDAERTPEVEATQAADDAKAAEASAEPLHILLVEDNTVNRILAQRQMARLGHRLDIAVDGQAGIRAVLDGDYDVVLMDRHLPDIDGLESTRRIRAAEQVRTPARHTPIIAVTADATSGHRGECEAAGMDGFLTKPLDLEQLRIAIDNATVAPDRRPESADVDPGALGRLNEALEGDMNAVADLVHTYLDELPANRMRLQVALSKSQARQAAAAAESLWASSETVGAVRLAQLCEQIHRAARSGDVERGRALLPDLRDTCDRTATALDRTVRSLPV